jgi:hypothetical protein
MSAEEKVLDIHPPHARIHSWQDFFLHLTTITIGLFIALSLEGMVEWFHHRHLVHQARTTIYKEMTDNRKLLADDLTSIKADEARIEADIKTLAGLRAGAKFEHASLQYHLDWSSFADSAWRTAEATGALNYMDYETAQTLSDIYGQQRIVAGRGLQVFDQQNRAIAPIYITSDPNLMSKDEIQLTLQRSADLLADLRALGQLLVQFDVQLTGELSAEAKQP